MECIFCLNENAYFDGVNYVCPDCGREWPCDEIADDDDDNNKLRCPEMTSVEIMTMMMKINYCNYGTGQIALLLPHYYMLQSEKD